MLEKFASGGLSAAAFCRKHRLPYHSFLEWRREAGGRREGAPRFAEIEIGVEQGRPDPGAGAGPTVELVLGGGMVLRIYGGSGRRP